MILSKSLTLFSPPNPPFPLSILTLSPMATTPFFLSPKLKLSSLNLPNFTVKFSLKNPNPKREISFASTTEKFTNNGDNWNKITVNVTKSPPNFTIRCSITNPNPKNENASAISIEKFTSNGGEIDGSWNKIATNRLFSKSITRILKSILKKTAITGVLLGLLLLYDHQQGCVALAASGGRMGGRSFNSASSSASRSYGVQSGGPSVPYSVPYYAPSPFGGGGGFFVGPAVGFGSSFVFVMMGFAAFVLVSGFLADRGGGVLTATEKASVLKVQVGLLGLGRSLQKDLNQIAETADTSTPAGLSYVLSETALALLRKPEYCISGYSSVDVKRGVEAVEKRFNQLSIEERGKFDEETLVNVNSIRKQSPTTQKASGFRNEYIVITIIVAAEGVHKLPPINGSAELKEALKTLASIPSSKIMAVEVLWTPQNENDTLTERELLEDYSMLRPL